MAKKNKAFKSESILQKRIKNFRKIKRGYYSFIIITTLYALSFCNPILINNKALAIHHNGETHYPAFTDWLAGPVGMLNDFTSFFGVDPIQLKVYEAKTFGQTTVRGENHYGEPHYRELKKQYETENAGNWIVMPPYPYSPVESLLPELSQTPPTAPNSKHFIGTDNRGRDVFARLWYGFQISISFALLVTFFGYLIGIIVGGMLGYFGGWFDIIGVRLIEIFSGIPFLFLIMILVSFIRPSFFLLVFLLVVFSGWIGISYFIRAEFFREKSRDYVQAAIAMGASDRKIMFKHILPNALVPVITFAPFAIVGGISSLVSLDYLGFGLRPPTPSWGELISQGMEDISKWWLIMSAFVILFFTLMTITFIGEAARQAFDPREHSRLR